MSSRRSGFENQQREKEKERDQERRRTQFTPLLEDNIVNSDSFDKLGIGPPPSTVHEEGQRVLYSSSHANRVGYHSSSLFLSQHVLLQV
ncbi:hypothetical protein J6590_044035 [Homalodisca vitripennis]|nr:hypothetical protein J6590_044035 [Homalodisca vitripennis]